MPACELNIDVTVSGNLFEKGSRLKTKEKFVVVDTETTGLSPVKCGIVDICILQVEPWVIPDPRDPAKGIVEFREYGGYTGRVLPEFDALIEAEATKVNGFSWPAPTEWHGAKSFAEQWRRIKPYLDGCVIIGHNPGFDVSFIRETCSRNELIQASMSYRTIDACSLSRVLSMAAGKDESHSLDAITARIGLTRETLHRAVNDARITLAALNHLILQSRINVCSTQC